MSLVEQLGTALGRQLRQTIPAMTSRVQLICAYEEAEKSDVLTVIFRTDRRLTQEVERAKEYVYPCQLFTNHLITFSAVMDNVGKGRLRLCDSELMTLVLSYATDAGTTFGVDFDMQKKVIRVPQVDFGMHDDSLSDAGMWRAALAVQNWPHLPATPPKKAPYLRVIHLPETLSEKAIQRATRMAFGWNFALSGDGSILRSFGKMFQSYAGKAETIWTA